MVSESQPVFSEPRLHNNKLINSMSIEASHTIAPKSWRGNYKNRDRSDEIGVKRGRLTVLSFAGVNKHRAALVNVACECGKEFVTTLTSIKKGASSSCGCFRLEKFREAATSHGFCSRKNPRPEYAIWTAMKQRCSNPKTKWFHNYGGRGIRVCERWKNSFENFYADMGPRPSPLHTIDRFPDNDGNYEPDNCKWSTRKEQQRHRRANVFIVVDGAKMIMSEAQRKTQGCLRAKVKLMKRDGVTDFQYRGHQVVLLTPDAG